MIQLLTFDIIHHLVFIYLKHFINRTLPPSSNKNPNHLSPFNRSNHHVHTPEKNVSQDIYTLCLVLVSGDGLAPLKLHFFKSLIFEFCNFKLWQNFVNICTKEKIITTSFFFLLFGFLIKRDSMIMVQVQD